MRRFRTVPKRKRATFHARSVVLNSAADLAVSEATAKIERFGDAYEGMEWLLARNPDQGTAVLVDGKHLQVYVHKSSSSTSPTIWAVYRFDEDQVEILALTVL